METQAAAIPCMLHGSCCTTCSRCAAMTFAELMQNKSAFLLPAHICASAQTACWVVLSERQWTLPPKTLTTLTSTSAHEATILTSSWLCVVKQHPKTTFPDDASSSFVNALHAAASKFPETSLLLQAKRLIAQLRASAKRDRAAVLELFTLDPAFFGGSKHGAGPSVVHTFCDASTNAVLSQTQIVCKALLSSNSATCTCSASKAIAFLMLAHV